MGFLRSNLLTRVRFSPAEAKRYFSMTCRVETQL